MYIFSFFKSLLKPRHIPASIYFLANSAIIFFIFYIMPFEIDVNPVLNGVYLGLIGLAVNFLFICISLTPFGEWIWRFCNNVRSQPKGAFQSQWAEVNQAFDEVKLRAVTYDKQVSPKVKLYYSPTNDINAFALGHRTVVVTRGILGVPADLLKGVLAHELGHIAHGDSDLKLGISVANGLISIFMTIVSIIANVIISITEDGEITNVIALVVHIIFNVIILLLFRLWCLIGVLLLNAVSRKEEYMADNYAKELGYDEGLAEFLYALDGNAPETSILSVMFQTHPDTLDRIANLGFEVKA